MILQQLINGLTIGSTYALVAIGYTMVFGILELVNFSHGSVYMTGAFITLMLLTSVHMNFFLSFTLSILLTGILGIIIDKIALYPLRKKDAPKVTSLISTIGVSIFLQNFIMMIWGSETKNFPMILDLGGINLGNAKLTYLQIIIFCICIFLMTALQFIVNKTKIGKAMRATAQNTETSMLMGINVNVIISLTFFIGSALASVAGTMVGMYYQTVDPMMGFMVGMKAFAAAVLGGIGVLPGAMLGGIIIGVIETLAAAYVHAGYRDAIAFAILIIVLIIRPTGLMGKQAPKKV